MKVIDTDHINTKEIEQENNNDKDQEILVLQQEKSLKKPEEEKSENSIVISAPKDKDYEIQIHNSLKEKVILNFKIFHNDLMNPRFFQSMDQIFSELISKKNNEIVHDLNSKEIGFFKDFNNLCGIVFEIDSFGGSAIDSLCLAEKINSVKQELGIPIATHIKTAYSAGYMLPSLFSDQIFISKYGEIGAIGVYFKEQNFSKILDAIKLDTVVFASEGTSEAKYHDSSMRVTDELEKSRKKDATRVLDQYFSDLNEKRPRIFSSSSEKESKIKFDKFDSEEDKNFSLFRSGLNLSSHQAKELGLVDSIGQSEDAKKFVKNLVLQREKENLSNKFGFLKTKIEPNISFKIIDIKIDDLQFAANSQKLKKSSELFFSDYFSEDLMGRQQNYEKKNPSFFPIKCDETLLQIAIQSYIEKILS